MEELAKLLTNYAFPVVVSLYLLTRLEKRIGSLEGIISSLNQSVNNLASEIQEIKEDIRYGSRKRNR